MTLRDLGWNQIVKFQNQTNSITFINIYHKYYTLFGKIRLSKNNCLRNKDGKN